MTDPHVTFGLSLPNRAVLFGGPITWDTLLAASERAEASGAFDSVRVGDNLLSKPRLEAIVALSAIASRERLPRLKMASPRCAISGDRNR